jgi:AcrR family transcriptional regulator
VYIAKDYDERKAEFLDTAMRLFMQQGYERTSVNAIIEAVGVSKGAFYHYFKTKEDLLNDLAARAADQALALVRPLVNDPRLSAVEKLNALFGRTNAFKAENRDLMVAIAQVFYSDDNMLLRRRMQATSSERVTPVLARIIEQGNAEGSMSVRYPLETAQFVLTIGSEMVGEFGKRFPDAREDPAAVDEILRRLEVYNESVERILGVEPGSLRLVDDSMIRLVKGE